MLVYHNENLISSGYTDSDFHLDRGSKRSILDVFTLDNGVIGLRSIKQFCIANSTMEAEYVTAYEAAEKAIWLKKFLADL